MLPRTLLALLLGLAFAPLTSGPVQAAVVYDNTATYLNLENALLPAGQANSPEHGNEVTLAGVERSVTSFTVILRIHGAAPAVFDLRVRFHRNDGPDGRPGTLLWESPLIHRVIDSGAPIAYPFTVPNVIVPDT